MSKLLAEIDLYTAIRLSETKTVGETFTTLGGLINVIVPNLFVLAGVIFLFLLIFGGFSIISSDSSKGVEEGKKKITTAIIGFLVMFSAYWVVQIVEFVTGITIL